MDLTSSHHALLEFNRRVVLRLCPGQTISRIKGEASVSGTLISQDEGRGMVGCRLPGISWFKRQRLRLVLPMPILRRKRVDCASKASMAHVCEGRNEAERKLRLLLLSFKNPFYFVLPTKEWHHSFLSSASNKQRISL